jgi:hypothetical protein
MNDIEEALLVVKFSIGGLIIALCISVIFHIAGY